MHISLTPELGDAVKAKVQSGLYNNASEVVREALRQFVVAGAGECVAGPGSGHWFRPA